MTLASIMQAADAAAKWHVHQRRKGPAQEPYMNHLLEVASLVATASDGQNADLVIAALLHDAIEDQEVPTDVIARRWGQGVLDIVLEVTDDKSLPKADRKRLQLENAAKKSRSAQLIKLADKTSNLRSIAAAPPGDWSVKRKLDYVAWASDIVSRLSTGSDWLEDQFRRAVEAVHLSVGVDGSAVAGRS